MLIKPRADIPTSEITDKAVYTNRRAFLRAAGAAVAAASGILSNEGVVRAAAPARHGLKFENVMRSPFSTDEKPNTWDAITTYNNYYEFGTEKDQPSATAGTFNTAPWTVAIEGECANKAVWNLEDVLKGRTLEDRIYRHRCVEAWSMVIPWVGFPLPDFIKKCAPTSKANYVKFTTLYDPRQMPGQRTAVLQWPYVEPGHRKADRRVLQAQDPDVQWLWRAGRESVRRHGS
jgi:sulfoxide reductase catalytic subunit YedY